MKRTPEIRVIIFFQLLIIFTHQLNAQMPSTGNEVTVLGWADDLHYLFRDYDSDSNLVAWKVNIRTGRKQLLPEVETDVQLLIGSLPEGVKADLSDVISPDKNSMVLIRDEGLYYFVKGGTALRRLTDSGDVVNVRFSPDGSKIAYTRNKDLYFYDLSQNREIRLTRDAAEFIYNGYASWVYMEEILGRSSNYAAFWWAPDGSKIAYLRTDENGVPLFTLNRLDKDDGIHGELEQVPYPKAGDPNPGVKMGIADLTSGETVWVKTDYANDQYIAWPFWTPDSRRLAIQIVNRDQNNLTIILANPSSGNFEEIYNETSNTWIEFHEDIYVMQNGTGFIIRSSASDGWENLYYYGWEGNLISQITDFDFRVTSIERVDEKQKLIYYYATGPESTDLHLYRSGLDGSNTFQITGVQGTHDVSISPSGKYFLDTWSNVESTGSIIAIDNNGKQIRDIHSYKQSVENGRNQVSELVRITTSDGLFDIPVLITYPLNFDPLERYPVIFDIYGGPDRKNVENKWQDDHPSWYSMNGIITVKVDHRGSGHFGKRGLDYLHRSLGEWEILDYGDAVRWLREKPFVHSKMIGIRGSSYGAYLTCLALTKGNGYWTHGFAGSPVTDWRLYDNIYTERYMDTPQNNPEGYKNSSAVEYAGMLSGKLYLNHGDMDDNVHMQNSLWLISKLQDEGKTFRFMIYPDERHGWRGAKRTHSTNGEREFWLTNFFGE